MDTRTLPRGTFVNPVDGRLVVPGTILGFTKRGIPIRVVAGGDGTGDDGTGGNDGGSGDGDGDAGAGNATGDAGKTPKIDGDVDKERVARTLAAARDSEKKAKDRAAAAEKSRQELIDGIAVALGLKPDPKTDPAALASQAAKELTDTRAELVDLRVENAVLRLAGKAGADVDALLDSRTFTRQLAELDPTASDFRDKVTAAIKDAVKANPKLAAGTAAQGGQGPARQGADHNGGGTGRQRPTSLGAAIAARMGGQ